MNINGNIVQIVPKYCNLGVVIKYNGRYNLATYLLLDKARKAYEEYFDKFHCTPLQFFSNVVK